MAGELPTDTELYQELKRKSFSQVLRIRICAVYQPNTGSAQIFPQWRAGTISLLDHIALWKFLQYCPRQAATDIVTARHVTRDGQNAVDPVFNHPTSASSPLSFRR